ncbi:MAG: DUF4124 domain-containing protein [Candidatus Thiodiazotropha sp.]
MDCCSLKASFGTAILIALLIVPGLAVAAVYQWTDAQGQVHFSDRPVADTAREVPIKTPAANAAPATGDGAREERTRRMLEVYQEDREKRRQEQQDREKRKRNCILAKDRYQSHSQASGIYSFRKDGQRQYLDEASRQRHMQKLKADVDKWCR